MLGARLKALRLRSNQTQQQVAEQLGISRGAYSHFENDRNEPDSTTIVKLAELFQVSTDFLLGRHTVDSFQQQSTKAQTVAAHIDEHVTDEQMDDIVSYIEFIKQRHSKRNDVHG
ncbi:helix-turn-helix domain-containing protein [Enterococcus sp. DIV0876]|uniref:helix-turn-helix domain-containing protein n=1 Tax=Enterococcus sp. DIV0876 TaxID=2774633 RepID=UPI003D2FBE16